MLINQSLLIVQHLELLRPQKVNSANNWAFTLWSTILGEKLSRVWWLWTESSNAGQTRFEWWIFWIVHSWRQTTTRSGFDETEIKYTLSAWYSNPHLLVVISFIDNTTIALKEKRTSKDFQKKKNLSLTIHDSWEFESQQSKTPLINSQMLNHAYN